jgi:hypothetical protein
MMRIDPSVSAAGAAADGAERTTSGLTHGALVWPAWAIVLLGALCVLIGLGYFAVRLYRVRRSKR